MSTDGPQNLQSLFETAQRVQQQISKIQDELGNRTVDGSAGGGMVTAVANGRQQLVSICIDREVIDPEDADRAAELELPDNLGLLGEVVEGDRSVSLL